MIFGLGRDVPDYLNISNALEKFRSVAAGRVNWLPIMQPEYNSGEFICFDENNNLVEWLPDGDVWPIEANFDDFLVQRTAELAKNLRRIISHGW